MDEMTARRADHTGNSILYTFGTYFFRGVSFVVNFTIYRLLGPEIIGAYAYVMVVCRYVEFLTVPVRSAIDQDVPLMRGAGKCNEIEEYLDSSHIVLLINAAVGTLVMWGFCWFAVNNILQLGFAIFGVAVFCESYSKYWQIYYKLNMQFGIIARVMVGVGCVQPLITLMLTYQFSYVGFFIGRTLMFFVMVGCYLLYLDRRFTFRIGWQWLIGIYRRGIPLALITLVLINVQNIDKLMIKHYLGLQALGYYNIGDMLFQNMWPLSLSIFAAYSPQFLEFVGGGIDVRNKSREVTSIVRLILSVALGVLILLLPVLYRFVVPQFAPGAIATNLLIIALYFNSHYYLYYLYLLAQEKYSAIIWHAVFTIVGAITLNYIMIQSGGGITYIAGVTLVVYIWFGYGLTVLGMKAMNLDFTYAVEHIKEDLLLAVPMGTVVLLYHIVLDNTWRDMTIAAGVYLLLEVPLFMYFDHRVKLSWRLLNRFRMMRRDI